MMKQTFSENTHFSRSSIISLANAKSQFKIHFGHKKKVQVGKDQEKAQPERDSHSKHRGGKKKQTNNQAPTARNTSQAE